MSERKTKLLETLEKALPNMPEFEQGYILAKAETYAMEGGHAKSSDSDVRSDTVHEGE